MSRKVRRMRFLAGAATTFAGAAFTRAAAAPEFVYRFGHDQTIDYPLHVRAVQMAADVKRETNGRLEIRIFPNSILGSDPAMIEQVRVGALEFSSQSAGLLSGVAPPAAIQQIPYAFTTEDQAVGAMTGDLGTAIRGEIALKTGFHFFPVMLNSGFTEITSSTHPIRKPDDLVGFKVRSRDVALNVDMYKVYGAQVVPISLGEVYSALQTRVVDGQDNIYGIIEAQRLYEVQKYLSVVDLVWGGQFFYCGGDAWKSPTARYPSESVETERDFCTGAVPSETRSSSTWPSLISSDGKGWRSTPSTRVDSRRSSGRSTRNGKRSSARAYGVCSSSTAGNSAELVSSTDRQYLLFLDAEVLQCAVDGLDDRQHVDECGQSEDAAERRTFRNDQSEAVAEAPV